MKISDTPDEDLRSKRDRGSAVSGKEDDIRNAAERIILITGATDGLCRRVAEDLASTGATLLLHGRNPEKGAAVLTEIRHDTGNERLRYYNADFSSLAEVRRLADVVASEQPRLDVLVNNAGLEAGPRPRLRETSVDGFELRFAINYLSPFLLTRRLLPFLRRAADRRGEARIVNVASAAQQALDSDDPMLARGMTGCGPTAKASWRW